MPVPSRRAWKIGFWSASAIISIVLAGVFVAYVAALDRQVTAEFGGRRWSEPTRVFANSLVLVPGVRVTDVVRELEQLRYRKVDSVPRAGEFRRDKTEILLVTRRAPFAEGMREPLTARLVIRADRIEAITTSAAVPLARVRLDPLVIGSLFPVHGEDRLIVTPNEIPPLLTAALKAVEDRDFDDHGGVDFGSIARAGWANLRAGEIEQGGSTLTQQLVKSYFLDGRRTWGRKLKEAIMAQRLEAHFDKREIMTAYINEVYLGQDGARAIHGFGLASQFYFGRSLVELDVDQVALLVGLVRGPSLYDPRRHPQRALERRNLVLAMLREQAVIETPVLETVRQRPITLSTTSDTTNRTYFPAYLDLVRRQLGNRGFSNVNAGTGHSVYTTLEPPVQRLAERTLTQELAKLEKKRGRDRRGALDGVVIVATPHNGQVIALVGGRNTTLSGFNRALDARRPIGSLVKPFVYLTALESGRYNAASLIDDAPIAVKTNNRENWEPHNFDGTFHGAVPLVRALAESMNLASVAVALDAGLEPIAAGLQEMGLARRPTAVPSLALGAVDATPLEVAQMYSSLATGGILQPLHVLQTLTTQGPNQSLESSGFDFRGRRVAPEHIVYQLNRMLVAVMEHGTGRAGRAALEPGLTVAGKSGTSSGFRDSWFAGFSGEHLVVVWVGTDSNDPTGLTGTSGALTIWSKVMRDLDTRSWEPAVPASIEERWIDVDGGEPFELPCDAKLIRVALPSGVQLPESLWCGARPGDSEFSDMSPDDAWRDDEGDPDALDRPSLGERIRNWWQRVRP